MFSSGVDLHRHDLYTSGSIILQDKASCLPAFFLAPPPHAKVLDACSAPGNKTTHLSALMNNTGTVYAFELNPSRFKILGSTVKRAGASNVVTHQGDFLKVKPKDYSMVTHMLLDPSCSCSGMVDRMDEFLDAGSCFAPDHHYSAKVTIRI